MVRSFLRYFVGVVLAALGDQRPAVTVGQRRDPLTDVIR
jgi:hypothetical protein